MKRSLIVALLLTGCLHAQAVRQNAGFKAYTVERNDDGSSSLASLGFTLNFFGKLRTHGWVNNNGNITFDSPLSTYTPFGLESTRREIVAAFFADVDTRAAGSALVTYGPDTINGRPAFGANYINVGYYNERADKLNRFQIVLVERSDTGEGNFDIEFNYEKISWETGEASGGVSGLGGVSASVGWSNGSGVPGTSYELEGSLLPGSFLDSGRESLVRGRMNSTVSGRWVFRARGGQIQAPLTMLTGCPLPGGRVASPYVQRMSAFGGGSSYSWSIIADPGASLVPGLSMSTEGTLSGTPTAPGTTEFTLRVRSTTEDGEQVVSRRCSLTVTPPVLTISSVCPLPPATVGQQYSRTLAVSGGRAPFLWSLSDDSAPLPAGLALSSSGMVTGIPTAAGTSIVNLKVTGNEADGGAPAFKTCSITVNPSTTNVESSCSLPQGTVGVPYSQVLSITGGNPPYAWSSNGGLPAGLSLTADGKVEGVPSTASYGAFRAKATDARGRVLEQTCTLSVQSPSITVDTACPLPAAMTGQPYQHTLTASGGTGPYSWSAVTSLPMGLSLSADGTLSGNPAAAGIFGLRFMVVDSEGRAAAKGCNLTIGRSTYSIASCPLPHGTVGMDYSQRLVIEGGSEPYYVTAGGSLPAGLSLTSSGLLTGRPRESGTFPISIRAIDRNGRATEQPCPITVRPSEIEISGSCPLPDASVGVPYLHRFAVSGGLPPYSFRLSGRLPGGLELGQDGTVRGTAITPGETSFEVEAKDSQNRSVAKACSVKAALPELPSMRLAGLPSSLPPASAGPAIRFELTEAYPLPIKGDLVLAVEADTGVNDEQVNRPDPSVRFSNGQRVLSFTLEPGNRQVSATVTSTGTVASLITAKVANLNIAGVAISKTPPQRQFRVPRAAPILSDACYAPAETGITVVITGSSSTRQITSLSVDYKVGNGAWAENKNRTLDVSGVSLGYFGSDESVRTGGAFTLTVPVDIDVFGATELSASVSNSIGASTAKVLQRCR